MVQELGIDRGFLADAGPVVVPSHPDLFGTEAQAIGTVLSGSKPACLVAAHSLTSEAIELLSMQGLECLGEVGVEPDSDGYSTADVIIAKRAQATDVLNSFDFSSLSIAGDISGKLAYIRAIIESHSVATALLLLSQQPWVIHNGSLEPIESEEVAIGFGILLGYSGCDISYYVNSRYGYAPKDEKEVSGGLGPHLLCPPCSSKMV